MRSMSSQFNALKKLLCPLFTSGQTKRFWAKRWMVFLVECRQWRKQWFNSGIWIEMFNVVTTLLYEADKWTFVLERGHQLCQIWKWWISVKPRFGPTSTYISRGAYSNHNTVQNTMVMYPSLLLHNIHCVFGQGLVFKTTEVLSLTEKFCVFQIV